MWLLNVEKLVKGDRQVLELFIGSKIPRYAILSHTWGQDEVTFKDIQTPNDPAIRNKRGFAKIEYTCRQVLQDGSQVHSPSNNAVKHAWVDTCCIDKSSSAELSEAINSMFNWYKRADVCYAYLEDIDASMIAQGGTKGSLQSSRWFTRGWTLQELLAPKNLRFYGAGDGMWFLIGRKRAIDILIMLSDVTGIPVLALRRPESIASYSVAARMSWASSRKTTRIEDEAYCLLGIFDISMALLYGEEERALQRLQEEIFRSIDDESILAWQRDDQEERFGIFARKVAWFRGCGGLRPCIEYTRSSEPVLSSRGLEIEGDVVTNFNTGCEELRVNCRDSDSDTAVYIRLNPAPHSSRRIRQAQRSFYGEGHQISEHRYFARRQSKGVQRITLLHGKPRNFSIRCTFLANRPSPSLFHTGMQQDNLDMTAVHFRSADKMHDIDWYQQDGGLVALVDRLSSAMPANSASVASLITLKFELRILNPTDFVEIPARCGLLVEINQASGTPALQLHSIDPQARDDHAWSADRHYSISGGNAQCGRTGTLRHAEIHNHNGVLTASISGSDEEGIVVRLQWTTRGIPQPLEFSFE